MADKAKPVVWALCTLLPEQGPDAWELNGVYATLEGALAACVTDQDMAVKFVLGEDYRDKFEFWQANPRRPEPFLVTLEEAKVA
ncbi:hypothetical protein CIW48_27060 [Methylobacterium sp. P1-11]|uniref:hypothetical protein n=1 Tax=Methylobacterium sp. P1-11 TaxID=2024616 RepID=UPI0011EEA14C|nr:hypothetical protein [Methylobacterium sp. P1-11]KAA0117865.1 hypothetical protein CIW48_27060 [Methylobacterium sp. P1-11]